MKIIKKADISNWSHKFTCNSCDSELEAESSDLFYSFHSGYGRETDYETYSVKCAVCNTSHTVKDSVIPKALKLEVKERTQRRSSNYFDR